MLGVPAGNLLSGPLGYRGVFALIGLVSAPAAVAVRLWLPRADAPPPVRLRERSAPADRRVLMILGLTALGCLAVFSVFTFIAPLLAATVGVEGAVVGVLLVACGPGGRARQPGRRRLTDRFGTGRLLVVLFVWGALTWSHRLGSGCRRSPRCRTWSRW